jgi:hypothetical protein
VIHKVKKNNNPENITKAYLAMDPESNAAK